jgi:hypothetical protein
MRIVAGRSKAACRVIKSGVHLPGDIDYVRFWHIADIRCGAMQCPLLGVKRTLHPSCSRETGRGGFIVSHYVDAWLSSPAATPDIAASRR